MAKMINSFIQLEKQGFTKTISPEFSLLKKPSLIKTPWEWFLLQGAPALKNIVFMKFNATGQRLAVVNSHRKEKAITIWRFKKIDEEIQEQ